MVLPTGFSKEEYVETFKDCFPYLWEDIVLFCGLRKDNYMRRKAKGLRIVPYYSPEQYLLKHVLPWHRLAHTYEEGDTQ